MTLQASGFINQGSQFLSSLLIAYLLGSHGQGLLAVAVMLQGLFYNFVHMGVVPATVSMVAASAARDMQEKVATWLAFLVKSYAVVSLLMVVGGWFLLPLVSDWLYLDKYGAETSGDIGLWAWLLTLWIPIDTPRALAQVSFHATRRMLPLAQLDNAQELMRMFLVVSGAILGGRYGEPVLGAVLGEILSRVLAAALAVQMYHRARSDGGAWLPGFGEILRRVPGVPLIRGMRLGVRVGVIKTAAAIVVTILPRLLLGRYASMSWVAYFHVAQRLAGVVQMMMQGVSRTVLPALSEQSSKRDLAGFKRLYLRSTVFTGLGISAAWLVMLMLVKPVVGWLWPADYAEPVFVCCLILTCGLVPLSFAVAQDPFYILTDRMKANVVICFAGALVTIPANMVLIRLVPTTGPVWGLTFYMAWVLVHFVYIRRYFRSARPGEGFWAPPEAPGSSEARAAPAAGA